MPLNKEKFLKIFFTLFLTLLSLNLMACPNISGTFIDEDDNLLTIKQSNCEQLLWSAADGETTLIADNSERIVEQDGKNVAYGKARFSDNQFILELRVVYAGKVPDDLPTYFLTSYRIDKYNNLVEKIESSLGTNYVTFRRK
jgi:hypothetical protein